MGGPLSSEPSVTVWKSCGPFTLPFDPLFRCLVNSKISLSTQHSALSQNGPVLMQKPRATSLIWPNADCQVPTAAFPMPHDLPKAYEPDAIEARWAEFWIREKLFSVKTPAAGEARPVFTLLLPPPNITGRLHMGHMLNQTQMDILVRWHRMRRLPPLWLPGTH